MKKGFTLIELLVVIAIIGILSSVVLASLNTARNKGSDAAVKSQLAAIRSQASVYYNLTSTGSYTPDAAGGNCKFSSTGTMTVVSGLCRGLIADATVLDQIKSVAKTAGADSYLGVLPGAWAAWAQLKSTTSGNADFWCVDSAGASKFEDADFTPSAQPPVTVCPN